MSKPIAAKSLKMIEYYKNNPLAKPRDVAAKFKTAVSTAYKIRDRAREESWQPPEVLPVPKAKKSSWQMIVEEVENTDVDAVLDSRAEDYGAFKDGAALMQGMKRLLADHAQKHNKSFADDQWEALEMIVHKIGRIVNGNPDKVDHWTDIAGYAKLVADRLEGRVR